ncbi:MAG: hypothetical protein P4K83_12420 [Terracidiphilus sp.]|nr:hypothetical protein [Terracidiphilus sp.]
MNTQLLKSLTTLDASDFEKHALSIAAVEYALEANDSTIAIQRLQVARRLRGMESLLIHDGIAQPALELLRDAISGRDEDEFGAMYRFREEIDRRATQVAVAA